MSSTTDDNMETYTLADPDMPRRAPDGVVGNVFFWLGSDAEAYMADDKTGAGPRT